MFEGSLTAQFERRKAEHAKALYRHYTLLRELEKLEEDLARMEAGLAELEQVKRDWATQKAIDEAQADEETEEEPTKPAKRKEKRKEK